MIEGEARKHLKSLKGKMLVSPQLCRVCAVMSVAALGLPFLGGLGLARMLLWLACAASPLWLPSAVVALRNRIFAGEH